MSFDALQYTVVRKPRRKTASIMVSRQNQISLVVPQWLSKNQIDEIVRKKKSWIEKRLRLNEEYQRLYPKKQFQSGESYLFLGECLEMVLETGAQHDLVIKEGGFLRVSARQSQDAQRVLQSWYERELEQLLSTRLPHYEKLLNVQAREVKIKHLESQWGNCRTGEVVTFNWKMVMAPVEIIDYIIVHELCHLIHLNHSAKFWKAVASVYPGYDRARKWLRQNGERLDF